MSIPTWARWPPFALIPAPESRPPISSELAPWGVFDALYLHDTEQDQVWPLSAVVVGFREDICQWWHQEHRGGLNKFGLTHDDILQWVKASRRIAAHWPYATPVAAQIVELADNVQRTIDYAEGQHPVGGHPRRLRQQTLSAKLWGLHRLRIAVNDTGRLKWLPLDWRGDILTIALPDGSDKGGTINSTIATRIERHARRVRGREQAEMANVLRNVLNYGPIESNGQPRPTRTIKKSTCL
jgi:hypothetical protein